MVEVFLDIKGYEGLYQVSNYGHVRSLMGSYGHSRELILKPNKLRNGYLQVALFKNGTAHWLKVHRLVAEAFIPNPDGLPQVNHIDEDKSNNSVWNLEWCTRNYNMNYGTRNERVSEAMIGKHINRKDCSKRVYQYTKSGVFVRSYASRNEAERQTGILHSNICAVALGKRKSAGGYIWSFIPPTPTTTRVLF